MAPVPLPPAVPHTSRVGAHTPVDLFALLLVIEDVQVELYDRPHSHLEVLFLAIELPDALIPKYLHVSVIWVCKRFVQMGEL